MLQNKRQRKWETRESKRRRGKGCPGGVGGTVRGDSRNAAGQQPQKAQSPDRTKQTAPDTVSPRKWMKWTAQICVNMHLVEFQAALAKSAYNPMQTKSIVKERKLPSRARTAIDPWAQLYILIKCKGSKSVNSVSTESHDYTGKRGQEGNI